jgi:hypothetical protein
VVVDPRDQLRQFVLDDDPLCRKLREITDRQEFIDTVAGLAKERGWPLDRPAIDAALVAARRSWLERWV